MPQRDDILDAAARALSRNASAATADIAAAAGVSRATLNRVAPGRAALLAAIAERAVDQAEAALDRVEAADAPGPARPGGPDRLAALVAELLPVAHAYGFLLSPAATWPAGPAAERADAGWERIERRLLAGFERDRAAGLLRPDVSAEWVLEAFGALLLAAAEAVAAGRLARRDAAPFVTRTLLEGVAPR
jgi:AcrR family transcriptional regulator